MVTSARFPFQLDSRAPAPERADASIALVTGRSCAGCTLCCKLIRVPELDKPRLKWCEHCAIGAGCNIYERRPQVCRHFYCSFLLESDVGSHWQPLKSKMVLAFEKESNRVVIHVDPSRPDAWRNEPYYSDIRRWAAEAALNGGQVLIWQGPDAIVILPGGEKNLGRLSDNQLIVTAERHDGGGVQLDVFVVDKDDPRLQKMRP